MSSPSSSHIALQRLTTEFSKLATTDAAALPGIVAAPRRAAAGAGGAGGDVDLLLWDFWLSGPAGSPYEAGLFTGTLTFPRDYPLAPPRMVFAPPITHPNVYAAGARAGEVCISILHAGADATGYERPEERWTAVHNVRSVLLSVQSMLGDCNVESPANVDAAKLLAADPATFRAIVRAEVERSLGLDRRAAAAARASSAGGGGGGGGGGGEGGGGSGGGGGGGGGALHRYA